MYHIPFWDTCQHKSLVRTPYLFSSSDKPNQHALLYRFFEDTVSGCAELDNKDSLRKAVESLFNKLYGKYMCVNYSVYIHDHCTEHSHVSLCLIH